MALEYTYFVSAFFCGSSQFVAQIKTSGVLHDLYAQFVLFMWFELITANNIQLYKQYKLQDTSPVFVQ